MRRADREVTDSGAICAILQKCSVLHLALNTDGAPYVLPVNFGMESDGMTFYIHGAAEGTKYALIAQDARAGFELECAGELVLNEAGHSCTMNYESVAGWGVLEEVTAPEEKCHALRRIMAQYHSEDFPFSEKPIPQTRIFRLRVVSRTAKSRRAKCSG